MAADCFEMSDDHNEYIDYYNSPWVYNSAYDILAKRRRREQEEEEAERERERERERREEYERERRNLEEYQREREEEYERERERERLDREEYEREEYEREREREDYQRLKEYEQEQLDAIWWEQEKDEWDRGCANNPQISQQNLEFPPILVSKQDAPRKNLEAFDAFTFSHGRRIYLRKGKLNDLKACEAKRWKARQLMISEIERCNNILKEIYKKMPFCWAEKIDTSPWLQWVQLHKPPKSSWSTIDVTPTRFEISPAKAQTLVLDQSAGDEWNACQNRILQVTERFELFEDAFMLSLREKAPSHGPRNTTARKFVINGRDYFFNEAGRLYTPEQVETVVV